MSRDILIVDDEADIRMLISGILSDEGYSTREAADSYGAFQSILQRRPNLLVLDIWLQNSELDGLGVLDKVKKTWPDLPVIMISGHGNIETAVSTMKRGAYDFIEKPFKADHLLSVVERALEASRLKRENDELRQKAGFNAELIGNSSVMQQLRAALEKVAPTGSRVLFNGPPGSGKEVAARWMHQLSKRATGPFIVMNCATMHPDRLEIELFGVESVPGKPGYLELAHSGTLLLDEVADMPLETQGKIVRALQEQTFNRVGGQTKVEVDVRVIASTSRDLQEEIKAGRFRQDLFYRLNVVPIRMPALHERKEDIPLLIEYLIQRSAEQSGLSPRKLAEDAIATLQAYEWPGNIRQLRNVADWLLIMSGGDINDSIRSDMLPPDIGSMTLVNKISRDEGEMLALPLREARELFEKQYLESQLDRFGGNISKTASFIGMERSALHRKLRSLGIAVHDRADSDKG